MLKVETSIEILIQNEVEELSIILAKSCLGNAAEKPPHVNEEASTKWERLSQEPYKIIKNRPPDVKKILEMGPKSSRN